MNTLFRDYDQLLVVYNFLADTREYIGKSDCHIPAGTGLPANCTTVAPPPEKPGFICVFNDGRWEYQEDHRGLVVYRRDSGTPVTVTEPGALPENTTTSKPPGGEFDRYSDGTWQPDLTLAKMVKISQTEQWRVQEENRRYSVSYLGHHWDCDKAALERVTVAAAQAAKNLLPDGFFWTDAANNDIELSAEQVIALGDLISSTLFTRGLEIHKRQREMKKFIAQATDVAVLAAFIPGQE